MKIKKEGWESSRAAPLSAHHSSKLELWRKTSTWKSSGMSSALSLIPERPPCCARPGANPPSTPLLLFPEHSQSIPRAFPGVSLPQQRCQCLLRPRGPSRHSQPPPNLAPKAAQSRPPKHTRGHASFPSKPRLPPGWPELQLLQKILHGICFVSCLVPFSYSGTVREKMLTLLMKENIG